MARNPLVTDLPHEQRLRECAYHLWEADGKPHGHDVEYWERARALVSAEESAANGKLAKAEGTSELAGSSGTEAVTGHRTAASRMAKQDETKPAPVAKRRSRPSTKRPKN